MIMSDDAIYATKGLTFMGGHDEKGRYILWGPTLREVYAIMVRMSGVWVPYKVYKNKKSKTHKHALQHLSHYRKKFDNAQFILDEIWEVVPINEMEKTYYEGEEEILSDIAKALGVGLGEFIVGLGRLDPTGHLMVGDRINGQIERVLDTATPEIGPFQFNIAKVPDPHRDQTANNGFGRRDPAVEGDIVPEKVEQSEHPGEGRDDSGQEGQGPEAGDNSTPEIHGVGTGHLVPASGVDNISETDAELGLETME